jgi:hypothetical protein
MSDESKVPYALFIADEDGHATGDTETRRWASELNQRMREGFEVEGEPTRRGQFGVFVLRSLEIDCDEPVQFPDSARDVTIEGCQFWRGEGVECAVQVPPKVERVKIQNNVVDESPGWMTVSGTPSEAS